MFIFLIDTPTRGILQRYICMYVCICIQCISCIYTMYMYIYTYIYVYIYVHICIYIQIGKYMVSVCAVPSMMFPF